MCHCSLARRPSFSQLLYPVQAQVHSTDNSDHFSKTLEVASTILLPDPDHASKQRLTIRTTTQPHNDTLTSLCRPLSMANRNQLPNGGQRALLPAPDPRTTTDGRMQGSSPDSVNGANGVQPKASGKSLKRAKVTAVACQPCQKRKSKVSKNFCLSDHSLTSKV